METVNKIEKIKIMQVVNACVTCLYLGVQYSVPELPRLEGASSLPSLHVALVQFLELITPAIIQPYIEIEKVRFSKVR